MKKENVMKNIGLTFLAIFFVLAQGHTQAGALDETEQEKLKWNLRNLLSPAKARGEASTQAGFRFDNFKLTNEAGATLFTGEDILLPAGNAGKKLLLMGHLED